MERKVQRLEVELVKLKRENQRLREALQLLPPESFLTAYSLLFEAAYLTRGPRPEIPVEYKRGPARVLVRNFRAHRMKRNVDKQLYRLRYQIIRYLEQGEEIPSPRDETGQNLKTKAVLEGGR